MEQLDTKPCFKRRERKTKTSNEEELLQFLFMFPATVSIDESKMKGGGGREERQDLLLLPGLSGLLHESHQKASGQGLGGQEQLSKVGLLTRLSAIEVFKHPH